MSERQPHNNPWAEKLQQATLPDGGTAWTAMEALLDREMPVREKKDRRRWLLLILLLLLIIGICNCPGRGRLFGDASRNRVSEPRAAAPERGSGGSGGRSMAGGSGAVGGVGEASRTGVKGGAGETGGNGEVGGAGKAGRSDVAGGEGGARRPGVAGGSRAAGGTDRAADAGRQKRRRGVMVEKPGGLKGKEGGPAKEPRGLKGEEGKTAREPDGQNASDGAVVAGGIGTGSAKKPPVQDSTGKKPAAKDSLRKKPPAPPKKEDEKESEKGFVVGLGLNQFFPVGGQQVADFNSGGISGTLGDYIPVPMVRYYFSKKLYIQLEAQFNAPQYTKKDLVINSAKPDTLSPGRVSNSTVSIQKLLYFNVPLSVHYAPIEGLSLGAGLQFSRLRNAFGSFDTTITNTLFTPVDSVIGKRESTLKGSTVYQQISTNEFRFLVDVNYTYRQFILGMRYNQALSQFINVQVGPGDVTQSRNSSLQLYLRYILWDGRKKKRGLSGQVK